MAINDTLLGNFLVKIFNKTVEPLKESCSLNFVKYILCAQLVIMCDVVLLITGFV